MDQEKDQRASETLEYAKDVVIQSIAETMDLYGVTPSAGKLYGTMYFSGPLNLDEMKDELKMSKPSMSTAVRTLQDISMVHKTWLKGSRKDVFVAEKNFFKSFIDFFCKKWDREVKINLESIAVAQQQLTDIMNDEEILSHLRETAQTYYTQLEESKKYYDWLTRLVASFRTGEIFDYLPIEE
ncbi:transcriptional regulator [Fictibacillus macauensis ZFHKF-1]|uniref:HTH-type transcriptional regulator n=1 Tax=Fictibacillus macauensis ZFHKF-1 TaxID=1196324 RepID=I8AG32_9BACL|nr:GbsR/MarR family transcriptional regulator [Fictibacillus macauensis]EIT84349.1 transcriptional regulator [Fictibacillus macauensis ZFHKF-1]